MLQTLPDPSSPDAPRHWTEETTGKLRPVVEKYLRAEVLATEELAVLRAYIRQWIGSPVWQGDQIEPLRRAVNTILDMTSLRRWLRAADEQGIDPL